MADMRTIFSELCIVKFVDSERSLCSATYSALESARNPSSPSTPAGIFQTSPSEIEVCSKHLNLAEN